MRLPRIIAIVGQRRSGKDTLAEHLVNHYQYKNIKLAHHLKQVCKTLFNLTDDEVEGDKKDEVHPEWNIKPRQLLQFIGTEIMQFEIGKILPNQNRCFWVRRMCDDINRQPDQRFVISDVRFIHEIEYLRSKFLSELMILRVERDIKLVADVDSHVSECEHQLINVDHVIQNNGTIDELYKSIDNIIINQS